MERTPRLYRRTRQRGGVLLGLCAGIGAHLGIDPAIIRLGALLLAVLNVAGLAVVVLYVIFALCIPLEPEQLS